LPHSRSIRRLLAAALAPVLLLGAPALAKDHARPDPGPWQAEASVGFLNPGNFTDIVLRPHETSQGDEKLAGIAVGRKLFDLGYDFSFELGGYAGHRIDEGGLEFAVPMTVVFDGLPWRDRLPLRLRLTVGPSFTTKISETEKDKDDDNQGSKLLNMFNPEIEVGVPGAPEWNGFFRLHHRSGIFGLVDGVTGGSTYLTVGVRHRFKVE